MKEYFCEVNIKFSGNNFEAKSKEDYIKKVKQSFIDEFGIKIQDYEIKNVERKENNE